VNQTHEQYALDCYISGKSGITGLNALGVFDRTFIWLKLLKIQPQNPLIKYL